MSLVVATYVPEGIVMASDSRQSVTLEGKKPDGKTFKFETVNSDAVTKTFLLEKQKVGLSNFGQGFLGKVPMASHVKRFREKALQEDDDVKSIAKKIVVFFRKDFPNADVGFHVCGYRKESKVSIPYVFYCHVGKNAVERRNAKDGSVIYGVTWSGAHEVLSVILKANTVIGGDGKPKPAPVYPIVFGAMALQDATDFSIYAIRTTIDTMRFQARQKSVGGPIDVLVITPESAQWIRKKELREK